MKAKMIERGSLLFLIITLVMGTFYYAFATEAYGADQISVTNQKATKNSITFNWSCNVPGAKSFKVARNPNNRLLASGKLTNGYAKGTIKDVRLSNGVTCQYRIAAYDSSGKRLAYKDVYITTLGIGSVDNLIAYPGYKSVTLKWNNVKGAKKYMLQRWDASTNRKTTIYVNPYKGAYTAYRDRKAKEANVNYAYGIWAIGADGTKSAIRAKTGNVKCVRQMYQNIKVNGTWKTANGYSGGKYYCQDGTVYSVTRISSATADYSRYQNYPNKSAENFANEVTAAGKIRKGKRGSKLVWISTYCQHIYVFDWTGTGWKLVHHWECSTGRADAPTPMSFHKYIDHRHYERHGLYWWSCFSTHNAMHGKSSDWEIDGQPHSSGCVRNENENAKWIYKRCGIGTQVISW